MKQPPNVTSDDPQAVIAAWEDDLRASQDQDKARKAVFDRWTKLNTAYEKAVSDVIGKVKKEVAASRRE